MTEWPPRPLEIEMPDAAGVPESGAELPGTTTRTQTLKIMMQSRSSRTRGAWMPSVSWSASGGGGARTRSRGVEPCFSLLRRIAPLRCSPRV
ncbi:hypothetical protein BV22DRAFT_377842 [Leucogyrophana mollusca]|uniref:Uncharacterized protein n=1 Tax=Leucogyrophana mollusca TaxID=85980 RepID=A0ACB8BK63_9AGAM|nr:hypothetical protein BV22DRAFT_377842 [Leucogyrophana mollusca]